MNTCRNCRSPATRSCTHCGRFCCESHVTHFHTLRYAGAVCTNCAVRSRWMALVGFAVFATVVSTVFFTVILPSLGGDDRRQKEWDREAEKMNRQFEEDRRKWQRDNEEDWKRWQK